MTRRDLVLHTFLHAPFALLVLSCARPNATALRPLLNSERIERVFGSYGVEVLESDGQIRLSNLYSFEGSRRICRTLAMVLFPAEIDPRIAAEQEEIAAGGSIGAVFKKAGFTIEKKNRYFGELPPDRRHREFLHRLMGRAGGDALAVHVYTMWLHRGDLDLEYATLAEIHHPDFLDFGDLRRIYGSEVDLHRHADPITEALLARLAAVMALAAS